MNTVRSFIALNISVGDKLEQTWSSIKSDLRTDSIKWVHPQVLHLTLFFLGETPISDIQEIKKNLSDKLGDIQSFSVSLKGLGTFGARYSPKVIWVGVEPSEILGMVYQRIVDAIEPLGYEPDERGFNPHITLGRVKHIKNVDLLNSRIGKCKEVRFQETTIGEVTLFKSELTPKGPIYTSLLDVKLQ